MDVLKKQKYRLLQLVFEDVGRLMQCGIWALAAESWEQGQNARRSERTKAKHTGRLPRGSPGASGCCVLLCCPEPAALSCGDGLALGSCYLGMQSINMLGNAPST